MTAVTAVIRDSSGPPQISVVIPCTRPVPASACLLGLRDQPGAVRMEVFVIGDVDGVEVPEGLDVTLVPHPDPHPNRRRVEGLLRARTELVAFLDDDTVPQSGWLEAALDVDPEANTVVGGPEHALLEHPFSRLIEEVSSSILTEASLAHRHEKAREVGWTDVPFSNVVLPMTVIDRAGGLGIDIPGDIDDLEFMLRCRAHARFENDPRLLVLHDRYPSTIRALLVYRWRVRLRVGEKLVTHSWLYWRIPQAVFLATAPAAGLAVGLIVGWRRAAAAAALAYSAVLAAQAMFGLRRVGLRRVPAYVGITIAIHVTNVVSVQVGLLKAAVGASGSGDYEGRTKRRHPAPASPQLDGLAP